MDDKKDSGHRVQITITIIGVVGALGAALLTNWDKVFSPEPTATSLVLLITPTQGPPTRQPATPEPPPQQPGQGSLSSQPTPICEKLNGKSISVTQYYVDNSTFYGIIGPQGIQLEKISDEDFSFSTTVNFGSADELVLGSCRGNALNITREGYGFTQLMDGILEQNSSGTIIITGFYINKGYNEGTFPWSGQVIP